MSELVGSLLWAAHALVFATEVFLTSVISSMHKHDWLGSLCSVVPDRVVADNDLHTSTSICYQVCIRNAVIPGGHVMMNLLRTTTYSTTCILNF